MEIQIRKLLVICLLTFVGPNPGSAAESLSTLIVSPPAGGNAVLQWSAKLPSPIGQSYSEFQVEGSSDLRSWQKIGGPWAGGIGVEEEVGRMVVPATGDHRFFRIVAERRLASDQSYGDANYGYAAEFHRHLQQIGQISVDDFRSRYQVTNSYLSRISFDPTTARYWDAFNLDPAVHNATNSADPRLTDFRMNSAELAVFRTNGFVVSPRLGSYSFADAFYRVYIDDLPVFISADSVLQAWHRTYVSMLQDIEETYLAPKLAEMLTEINLQLWQLYYVDFENFELNPLLVHYPHLKTAIEDASLYAGMAGRLGGGLGPVDNIWSQLASIDAGISSLTSKEVNIFGTNRVIDFSQLKIRGHYESTRSLQSYFYAMMWCGLVDFRFTGNTNDTSARQLAAAAVLNLAIEQSGQKTNWIEFEKVLRTFVGVGDSLNPLQFSDLMSAASIHSLNDLTNKVAIESIRDRIMAGELGVQNIRGDYLPSPLSPEKLRLPRSMALFPRRFVLDSWALSKVVFDDIIWDTNGIPEFEDKVPRRVPSALDIAFSVFGNDQIVPELATRMTNSAGHPWRDGWPYQHNLSAVRETIDLQSDDYWTNNIYASWLHCLRPLSKPTTATEFPEAMRTRAWAMRNLNAQLASWTQLRHDTVLYAKQSYTAPALCGYPAGYVDPNPEFWRRIEGMARRTKAALESSPTNGITTLEGVEWNPSDPIQIRLIDLYQKRQYVMDRFIYAATNLANIATKQLAREELTTNEVSFLRSIVEQEYAYVSGNRTYTGWYPSLFYRSIRESIEYENRHKGSDRWDPLVTDVHTDTPDLLRGDPGSILHQGVGNVHMALVAVDCGGTNATVYAGPVFSHFEFELGPSTRKSDSEWKADIKAGNVPSHPEWTRSYLVPGNYVLPPDL